MVPSGRSQPQRAVNRMGRAGAFPSRARRAGRPRIRAPDGGRTAIPRVPDDPCACGAKAHDRWIIAVRWERPVRVRCEEDARTLPGAGKRTTPARAERSSPRARPTDACADDPCARGASRTAARPCPPRTGARTRGSLSGSGSRRARRLTSRLAGNAARRCAAPAPRTAREEGRPPDQPQRQGPDRCKHRTGNAAPEEPLRPPSVTGGGPPSDALGGVR